jgi:hypothetical protein
MLRMLGLLCDTYPNSLTPLADKVAHCFIGSINKQQDKQIDTKLVEGLFIGLSRFLNQFSSAVSKVEGSDQLVLLYKFTMAAVFSTSEKTFGVLKGTEILFLT